MTALLNALEAHRLALAFRLDTLPSPLVHARPRAGAWSLAQVADHLLQVDGTLSLEAVRRGRAPTRLGALRSRAGRTLLGGVLALPVRIPAPPSASGVMPRPAPRWPEVREAWDSSRAEWRAALPEASPRALALQHPIAGPLCLDDALAFLLAHARHHNAQVERTLRALGQSTTATRRVARRPLASATTR